MTQTSDQELARYAAQTRFSPLGVEGQRALQRAHVLICGCGALGSVLANTLVRAGLGRLRLVDRDFLELHNLQRQVIFDEDDIAANKPKAIAAADKLRRINSQVAVEPIVADVDSSNVLQLSQDVDLILDGTDNFEARFLLNDAAHKLKKPWIYAGCLGAEGQTLTIVPGTTPCLRCLMDEAPPPGTTATCDTAGILGSIINVIASIAALEAMKLLSGRAQALRRSLLIVDLWENRFRQVQLDGLRETPCPACRGLEYPWLEGRKGSQSAVLCGRNAVQLSAPSGAPVSLPELAARLQSVGRVTVTPWLLRLAVAEYLLTIFPDGRTIVSGTDDPATARTIHARYIGA